MSSMNPDALSENLAAILEEGRDKVVLAGLAPGGKDCRREADHVRRVFSPRANEPTYSLSN